VSVLLQDVFGDFLTKDFNVIDIGTALGNNVTSVLTSICQKKKNVLIIHPPILKKNIALPVVTTTELSALV
jgi:hypothetical protein